MNFVALLGLGLISAAVAAPSPPFWGPFWTATFNQTITYSAGVFNDFVVWHYDSTTKPVGSSLYEYGKGQHDELCTSVSGFETSDEPCHLLASVDTWRYIIFPESQFCCRACSTSDYCGIVRPDWLQENATYVDRQVIDGLTCDGWVKVGGEQNFYYSEINTQQPCLYYEGYPVLPKTSNYWRFNSGNFSRDPIPSSVFAIPSWGCNKMCPQSLLSYEERLQLAFQTQQQ